ncbi:TauD/TfdA family dioxygenase [Bradyrhizobium sp. SZCCHNR2009]|uniref:TauD/TfdA family dioxygenase n=1 Tax=Bradyrhizobium sp. SZCCHNR2009 TaxID=3057375 RepID=UPI0039656104
MNNIIAEYEGASYALDRLREAVASHEAELRIASTPGDLIIYSNTRMMHRRRCYAPRFDGADRYEVVPVV